MGYRFELDESPQAGLRRIVAEETAQIVARLTTDADYETAIHDSRKRLKRLKALFKLVRRALPKDVYAEEYGLVRDIGRALSSVRDFHVMPTTLVTLCAASDADEPATAIEPAVASQVQAAIAAAHAELIDGSTNEHEQLPALAGRLVEARSRHAELELDDDAFEVLALGTAHGLRMLRRQHKVALAVDSDEAYHDWRKSAQLHWRQLRLLREIWPAQIGVRVAATKSLAFTLGHDHDLSVLAHFIDALPAAQLAPDQRCHVVAMIAARQQLLRREARAYAGLLVGDGPYDFARRLQAMHTSRKRIAELSAPLCALYASPDG